MKKNRALQTGWMKTAAILAVVVFACCAVRALPYLKARPSFETERFTVSPKPDGDVRTRFLSEAFQLQKGVYTIQYDGTVPTETELVAGNAKRLQTEDGADLSDGVQCMPLRVPGGSAHREWRILAECDTEAALLVREYYEGNGVPAAQLRVSVIYRPMLSACCYALDTLLAFAVLFAFLSALYPLFCLRRPRQTHSLRDAGQVDAGQTKAAGKPAEAWIPLLLFVLVVFISFPLFRDYVTYGHDTVFHVRRIAALSEELFSGRVPVRLSQTWKNGYGYPVSIFYGDLFLIPAAVLFRLGVPLFRCYQLHVLLMNVVTVRLSYHCFKRIAGRPWPAFFGSVLYAGSVRYAANLYLRGAIGEGMGMAALLLVAAGFYELLKPDGIPGEAGKVFGKETVSAGTGAGRPGCAQGDKAVVYLTLGFTALIQAHTLTTIQAAVFAFLFCLLHARSILRGKRIRRLLAAAGWTALLNLWFIVPFVDYYRRHAFYAKMSAPVADTAVEWTKIFTPEEPYQAIGTAMLLLLAVCAVGSFAFARNGKVPGEGFSGVFRPAKRAGASRGLLLLSVLAVLMGTTLFPWTVFETHVPAVYGVLGGRIQYVWRYFSVATMLICVTAMVQAGQTGADAGQIPEEAQASDGGKAEPERSAVPGTGMLFRVVLAVLAVAGLSGSAGIMNESLHPEEGKPVLRAADVWNGDGGDALYLFDDLLWYEVPQETVLAEEGLAYTNVTRDGTSFAADVVNTAEEARQIAFPVWNYYGYAAKGAPDDGASPDLQASKGSGLVKLAVTDAEGHRVSVEIPAGFSGRVSVGFREPWYWRVAEIVSLLTAIAAWIHCSAYAIVVEFANYRKASSATAGRRKKE